VCAQKIQNKAAEQSEQEEKAWGAAFNAFVHEFKGESDRAAVILGAAKLDSILGHILDRFLLPAPGNTDELLDGDAPLATFSSKINACYRLGLISAGFAKSLHLIRRIRNSFAHEVVGVSLETGAHADRLKALLLPFQHLPRFVHFRNTIIGKPSASNDFRACLSLVVGRLEYILERIVPLKPMEDNVMLLPGIFDPINEEDSESGAKP
jgi:hypothetical protein